jgi:hypothetical protein
MTIGLIEFYPIARGVPGDTSWWFIIWFTRDEALNELWRKHGSIVLEWPRRDLNVCLCQLPFQKPKLEVPTR